MSTILNFPAKPRLVSDNPHPQITHACRIGVHSGTDVVELTLPFSCGFGLSVSLCPDEAMCLAEQLQLAAVMTHLGVRPPDGAA
jgi:hypothetical protein